MEERASQLLALPDHVLFTHGGCHVFALVLREFSGLPLLWIHEGAGSYDHVACDGGGGSLLDVFGWFSYSDYIRAEWLNGRDIRFDPIEETQVMRRFTLIHGPGYYAHKGFWVPARERARAWIAKYDAVFGGTSKIPIPGLTRIQTATNREIESVFD